MDTNGMMNDERDDGGRATIGETDCIFEIEFEGPSEERYRRATKREKQSLLDFQSSWK